MRPVREKQANPPNRTFLVAARPFVRFGTFPLTIPRAQEGGIGNSQGSSLPESLK